MRTARVCALAWACILSAAPVRADVVAEVNRIRATGCEGRPAAPPLRAQRSLHEAARLVAGGRQLRSALRERRYAAMSTALVRIASSGDDGAVATTLRQRFCERIMEREFREIGVHRRGNERWIVLAAPFAAPAASEAGRISLRVLQLVNDARARPRRCGAERFGAAAALKLVSALEEAARVHAQDMAKHSYLEHRGRDGRTPGDRLRSTGYQRRLVGENIAAGPTTPEELVQGWLASPEHCANIMDARFKDMGVAYAFDRSSSHGIYWAQLLAAPR